MSDLDKYAQMAADMAAPDFLLRLVQEREGLQQLIVKWRDRDLTLVDANEYGYCREYRTCADQLAAVIAALADQSS